VHPLLPVPSNATRSSRHDIVNYIELNINVVSLYLPVTEAERSEASTAFARSDAGIVGSNPIEAWMFVYVYSVFVLGSGLAIG
jgi:hypothetical protein